MGAIENLIEIAKTCAPYWTTLIKDIHVTEKLLISGTRSSSRMYGAGCHQLIRIKVVNSFLLLKTIKEVILMLKVKLKILFLFA